jgi:hypothetical protein
VLFEHGSKAVHFHAHTRGQAASDQPGVASLLVVERERAVAMVRPTSAKLFMWWGAIDGFDTRRIAKHRPNHAGGVVEVWIATGILQDEGVRTTFCEHRVRRCLGVDDVAHEAEAVGCGGGAAVPRVHVGGGDELSCQHERLPRFPIETPRKQWDT